jgi:hypothetical protein
MCIPESLVEITTVRIFGIIALSLTEMADIIVTAAALSATATKKLVRTLAF